MANLLDIDIHFNSEGWGPISGSSLPLFQGVPYAHFDKKEKIGRPADFVSQTQNTYQRHRRFDNYSNDFAYRHDAVEDSTFQLVDTTKTFNKAKSGKRQTSKPQQRTGGARNDGKYNTGPGNNRGTDLTQMAKNKMMQARAKMGGANNRFGKRQDRKDRNPSLAVDAEWEILDEFDLAQLVKLQANQPSITELLTCGHVDQYDDAYEKMTSRAPSKLRRSENKLFYYVTSKDDPVLERFAVEGLGDVFATDAILAQLMVAPKSIFSWDIVVQKVNGMIFLDKREDSTFDLLTVSETAQDPPTVSEEAEEYNHPDKLSLEATLINQNFSQQVLMDPADGGRKSFEPNPFFDDSQTGYEPASVAYVYRQFNLGSLRIVARCEVHGWVDKRDSQPFMTCYALNEWDSRYSGGVNWRQKIDATRAAVLAAEIKNNNAKIAKWTAQSILANAGLMKVGYVSRVSATNPYDHQILATQFLKPKEFAVQLGMSLPNIWGIIKMFCETLMAKSDGKYLIMKDPNKQIVRLYAVPMNAFEEDADDDEEEEEGENEGEVVEEDATAAEGETAKDAI